ncbi:MAG: hypothetical protein WD749_12890 [Phycisphaerales bacterium]
MPHVRTRHSGLRDRLGTYFLGVAIGCVLVGVLLMMRRAMIGPPPQAAPQGQPAPAQPAPPATP